MVNPIGLGNKEISERTQNVVTAWNRAQGSYVMNAIVAHTSQDLVGLLAGAITMILGAAVLVIVGNVGGAALGGALGALAGGAGAAPGAALGRTIGNFVVMKFLEYLGVALLLTFIAEEVGVIGYHFMVGIDTAWNAPSGGKFRDIAIDFAARHIAEGVGKFFGALVMALVIVLTRGAAQDKTKVLNSKLNQICNRLCGYIQDHLAELDAKYKNGLPRATVTAGLPETAEDVVKEQKRAVMAKPFADMPSFYRRHVTELQEWLGRSGFEKVAEMRRPGQTKPDGSPYTDFQSEIWMRQRGNQIECVRIDPEGHTQFKVRDGPIRIQKDPATGKWSDSRIAWGERPHYHLESIPPELKARYLTEYTPQAVAYEMNGKSVNAMQAEHQRAQEWSTRVFGEDGQLAPLPNRFNLIHIPLMP